MVATWKTGEGIRQYRWQRSAACILPPDRLFPASACAGSSMWEEKNLAGWFQLRNSLQPITSTSCSVCRLQSLLGQVEKEKSWGPGPLTKYLERELIARKKHVQFYTAHCAVVWVCWKSGPDCEENVELIWNSRLAGKYTTLPGDMGPKNCIFNPSGSYQWYQMNLACSWFL